MLGYNRDLFNLSKILTAATTHIYATEKNFLVKWSGYTEDTSL